MCKYRAHSLSHDSSTCSNEQDKKQGHITTKKTPKPSETDKHVQIQCSLLFVHSVYSSRM